MSYRFIVLFFVTASILGGCASIHSVPEENGPKEISDWSWFSLKSLTAFREHIIRDNGSVALTTYDTTTTDRLSSDFSVHLYPALTPPCSPSITGASKLTPLASANGDAVWGKVELLSAYNHYPDAICAITAPECTDRELFNGTCKTKAATYALCAQKDEKTVLICISQMTDDEPLAKSIFETFRWLPSSHSEPVE